MKNFEQKTIAVPIDALIKRLQVKQKEGKEDLVIKVYAQYDGKDFWGDAKISISINVDEV